MRDTSLQRRFGCKGNIFFRIYQNKPEKKKKKIDALDILDDLEMRNRSRKNWTNYGGRFIEESMAKGRLLYGKDSAKFLWSSYEVPMRFQWGSNGD